MANKLLHKCDVCNSWFWCGRSCGRAPVEETPTITLEDGSEVILADVGKLIISTADGDRMVEFKPPLPSYKYRDPEKRRAYMKEYMRKRRAKTGDDSENSP